MVVASPLLTAAEVGTLRTELIDLAFELERRRRFDAADVALALEARLRELVVADPKGAADVSLSSRIP